MTDAADKPRRRYGPAPLHADAKRSHTVSVRLNVAELAHLDHARLPLRLQRGAYLRTAALLALPSPIPEINRQAWSALARAAANLNQLARQGYGGNLDIEECRDALAHFRQTLIGARDEG